MTRERTSQAKAKYILIYGRRRVGESDLIKRVMRDNGRIAADKYIATQAGFVWFVRGDHEVDA